MNYVYPRGYGKPYTGYFLGIEKLYRAGEISFEDYVGMIAAAKVILLKQSEDEVFEWMEEEFAKLGKGENNEC